VGGAWQRRVADGVRWVYRADAALEPVLPRLAADPGPPLAVARLRRSRSFHAMRTAQGDVFVKRLAPSHYGVTLLLRVALRRMRGAREFRNAVRAHARGAAIPEPLAFGVRQRPLRRYESWLVYRSLPAGSRPLAETPLERMSPAQRDGCLAALARLAADLHERGVFHLDLTPHNVLRTGGPDEAPVLVAVDLETVRLARPGALALAARSLARLEERFAGARDDERERFFSVYLAARSRVDRDALCRRLRRARALAPRGMDPAQAALRSAAR
jgi:tRNA A-37 threonylcarbamoyl transferase component Bud32